MKVCMVEDKRNISNAKSVYSDKYFLCYILYYVIKIVEIHDVWSRYEDIKFSLTFPLLLYAVAVTAYTYIQANNTLTLPHSKYY